MTLSLSSIDTSSHYVEQHRSYFQEKILKVQLARQKALRNDLIKPSILILGAGLAGLSRALCALRQGIDPIVLERRAESCNGRENIIVVYPDTLLLLDEFGIYDYLVQENCIHFTDTAEGIHVRLCDLEKAMKVAISFITPDPVIYYEHSLSNIRLQPSYNQITHAAECIIEDKITMNRCSKNFDIVVVAEGSHSYTNTHILKNSRVTVLQPITAISAIFTHQSNLILKSTLLYRMRTAAACLYYYAAALFHIIFLQEHTYNKSCHLLGVTATTVPNHNYIGLIFSKKYTKKIDTYSRSIAALQNQLANLKKEQKELTHEYRYIQQQLDTYLTLQNSFIRYWANVAFCWCNIMSVVNWIFKRRKMTLLSWLPLKNAASFQICADKSQLSSIGIGSTTFLMSGDTLATTDPSTGIGGNVAIKSSNIFNDFIAGIQNNISMKTLCQNYDYESQKYIFSLHIRSRASRLYYRPDEELPIIAYPRKNLID